MDKGNKRKLVKYLKRSIPLMLEGNESELQSFYHDTNTIFKYAEVGILLGKDGSYVTRSIEYARSEKGYFWREIQ